MMRWLLSVLPFILLLTSTSCATQVPEDQVDTTLGVGIEEESAETEQELAALREQQEHESRRHLERQITDPLAQ